MLSPAWTVQPEMTHEEKRERERRKNRYWNRYKILPSEENGNEPDEEYEYFLRRLCRDAAQGDNAEQDRLFHTKSLFEVYQFITDGLSDQW